VGADLRKQALGAVLGGLAKKYCTDAQAAADSFFEDAQAFGGAVSGKSF
jgi:hypothetical protein